MKCFSYKTKIFWGVPDLEVNISEKTFTHYKLEKKNVSQKLCHGILSIQR